MKPYVSVMLLGCGVSCLAPAAAKNTPQTDKKPNVLFIVADQFRHDMLSCKGNPWLSTPNLDRLAARGYSFNTTYAVNTVSMPSRFGLMTGHYASEVGIRTNGTLFDKDKVLEIAAESSLGNLFRAAGYRTLYSGMTNLYGTSDMTEYGFELHGTDPYDGPVEYAEKFFAERGGEEQPFFLYLAFMNPHDICYGAGMDPRFPDKLGPKATATTKKYLALKDAMPAAEYEKQIPPPPANTGRLDILEAKAKVTGTGYRDWNDEQWGLYRWMYHRLAEDIDAQIGRVLGALEKAGLDENTLVVFTSDHGEHCQSHGLVFKFFALEEAQRVPLIFAGPGVKSGVMDRKSLVCNGTDFAPTVCDLAGVGRPSDLSGVSLAGLLAGRGGRIARDYIFAESSSCYQINDGRYKFTILEYAGNPEMLFDLKTDPGETRNLAAEPGYAATKAKLKKALLERLASRGLELRSDYVVR